MRSGTLVIAIDPGETTGWATWCVGEPSGSRRCGQIVTFLPWLEQILYGKGSNDVKIIMEDFVLYADETKIKGQLWKPMKTSELMGAIDYLAAKQGISVERQPAMIKNATRKILSAKGYKRVAKGVHAMDAELHLACYCLKKALW